MAKTVCRDHDYAVFVDSAGDVHKRAKNKIDGKILGDAVRTLTGSFLEGNLGGAVDHVEGSPDEIDGGGAQFYFKRTVSLSAEDYQRTTDELNELVKMRNALVHHFIEQFELGDLVGCEKAVVYLGACYDEIDRQYCTIHRWGKSAEVARAVTSEFIESDEFDRFVLGALPDRKVDWAASTIVAILRQAEAEVSSGGWASLNEVIRWIATKHPEQTPLLYGCSRWRHLLHESKLFEIQRVGRDSIPGTGTRFRSKRN